MEPEFIDASKVDADAVIALLTNLLQAWGNGSAGEVRLVMACLDAWVSPVELVPIQNALDSYDFEAGASLARTLMESLLSIPGFA